ncbi:MAG: isoamylase early set domain-containing protein [Acidobacteria bacterium]|nr:isoamylase early set domain-containing protein [Acidobacteriota bacterium]MDW7983319.1 isoamylase early set domain-containing protein [Acidobacteriota bacterium]
MIRKKYYGKRCWVTFEVPGGEGVDQVEVVGEWNGWQPEPMNPRKDGFYSLTKVFRPGEAYRFRYLINGCDWRNEEQADGSVPNPFGSEDSVVRV